MRATNGFPEILPLPVTSSSWWLFGCLAVSSDLSLFIDRCLSFTPTLSLLFFLLSISDGAIFRLLPLVLSYSGGFLASGFVCTHTLDPQEPLDCEFPQWKRKMRGKFPYWGNKWTWSRNWFSCPTGKGFSLRLPNHPIVCRVCRNSWQSQLDISCTGVRDASI